MHIIKYGIFALILSNTIAQGADKNNTENQQPSKPMSVGEYVAKDAAAYKAALQAAQKAAATSQTPSTPAPVAVAAGYTACSK